MPIATSHMRKTLAHINMTRTLTILFICLTTFVNAQISSTVAHEYSILGEFVELKITDNNTVELYIWPYDDCLFSGQCIQSGDTLSLDLKAKNDSIAKIYSYPMDQALLKTVSELLMVGDYLIPTQLVIDSTHFNDSYIYRNRSIRYILHFSSDSTFKYKHGGSMSSGGTEGEWTVNNKQIKLKPKNDNNVLHWICSDYELTLCKNYIVGKRDANGTKTLRYLEKKK